MTYYSTRGGGYARPVPPRRGLSGWWLLVPILVLIGLGIGACSKSYYHQKTWVATVENKDRICDSGKNGSCYYVIYTTHGTIKNTDSLVRGKFRSSDIQGQIKVGATYQFTVQGWRLPLFSEYPNLVDFQSVSK